MEKLSPDYPRIYNDIIDKKFPHLEERYRSVLAKKKLSVLEVIDINKKIFGISAGTVNFNQRHRSYNRSDILKILDYQKKNKLNNSQLAVHFNLSRNTVTKWKKLQ